MYLPAQRANLLPVLISSMSFRNGNGEAVIAVQASTSSTAFTTNNRAIYVPLYIDRPGIVTKFWCWNGATSSGNVDIGLYNDFTAGDFTKIVSTGAVAQGTVSVIQEFDVTDFALAPGVYFLGLSVSAGAATFFCAVPNVLTYLGALGMTTQLTAHPLPSTAVPVTASQANIPVFGIAFRTLVA